jgi:hypothetical protein
LTNFQNNLIYFFSFLLINYKMSTSAYYLDVQSAQYNSLGCPSQCMSKNEYSTVGAMYSIETDPKSALLQNMNVARRQNVIPLEVPTQDVVVTPSTFGTGSILSSYNTLTNNRINPPQVNLRVARHAMPMNGMNHMGMNTMYGETQVGQMVGNYGVNTVQQNGVPASYQLTVGANLGCKTNQFGACV